VQYEQAGATAKSCVVDGCSKGGRLRRDMCEKHYYRAKRNGDPGRVQRPQAYPPEATCIVEGCSDGGRLKRGMCSTHYQRLMRRGDPNLKLPSSLLKHGMTGSPEFVSWSCMITRTTNPKAKSWSNYGGRGISICGRWRESFEAFYQDLGPGPKDTSIDRIDVNGNYSCGKCEECLSNGWLPNCRWADPVTQGRNKRGRAS
jgi:hypothetical protein